ncbi:MAG: hypothetical protein AUJ49_11635 [Desulfovibrionaceae bacterium CG1_02_65_16]|nr:MAG: hypothetical protein AUJ49_11635 [Desulfovibrionaceae bacterium CG1_02_65_16]
MTQRPARRRVARLWALALVAATALLTTGCMELNVPQPSSQAVQQPSEQTTADLAAEAEGFWKGGDWPRAELLYSRLLERGDINHDEHLQALDRLAQSAFKNRHYHQARHALDMRAGADQSVLATWPWHDLYLKTLMALGRADLLDAHQAWIMAHTELPYVVRCRAIMAFAEYAAQSGDAVRALNLLADIHRQAPDVAASAWLEGAFAANLRELPDDRFAALSRQVGPRPQNIFPHALIQREAARRGRQGARLSPAASTPSARAGLTGGGTLLAQNATRLQSAGSDQPAALLPRQTTVSLALVLPLTGRFAATGQKVLRGASAARKILAAKGRNLEIKVINTEASDWRAQLAALPPGVAVVGGPLLAPDSMRALQADGTLGRRAVFAFQPDLGTIREGRQAWRFYPSLKDQARALIDLTAEGLGIRSVAVLAPRDHYGQRMAEVFQTEARARGLRVAGSETYPPDDHPRWMQSVSHLLKVPDGFRHNKNMPLPMPDFGAVFLPEDWSQAEMLTSDFYFFEGQQLLFLGTDLWSVGLDNAKDIDDTYFQHAACPGAWWPETVGARALQTVLDGQKQGQQADFWVALGYDFVRLADRLALGPGWTPAEVNARLAALSGLDYSMAPVLWSADGVAKQKLYVFTPRKEGKALVDVPTMRESIDKARDRREHRVGAARETQKSRRSAAARDAKE